MPSRFGGAVVPHESKPKSQDLRDPKAVNKALRPGTADKAVKKFDAGSNKKAAGPVIDARKLDEAAALDWETTDLKVVQEYENGKAVPNQAVLAKIERVLGVKLRGKRIGRPT
ncbi:Multiprotein-bridging factor 1c [Hibiscus syriacus]|uniref:Multiprotein-bridging factor 1c n=1 Tax=Hibiscus syriacus TaxID=106335 RepID=A0A6A3AMK1_HIBSY|nr:Multiprotein-bridging factor 1c [Hibiscus syriacus]